MKVFSTPVFWATNELFRRQKRNLLFLLESLSNTTHLTNPRYDLGSQDNQHELDERLQVQDRPVSQPHVPIISNHMLLGTETQFGTYAGTPKLHNFKLRIAT